MLALSMIDPSRFVVSGYVPLADHGFALPCYTREEGGNAWHIAVANITGDKTSTIARFQSFDSCDIRRLEEPLRRSAAISDQWLDVFLWGTRISVGRRDEVLTDVDDLMEEISTLAPLSAFDLAFDMGQNDAALVANAAVWLRLRYGAEIAEQTLTETVLSYVASLRVRRWAFHGGWANIVSEREVAVVTNRSSGAALRLPEQVRHCLEGDGHILALMGELKVLAAAAGVSFADNLDDPWARANMPTPTYDRRIPRRFADFETLGEALNYAAQGLRGLNFHDARGNLTQPYTFAELRTDSLAMAYRLIAYGIVPGDRVALVAETGPDFAALFFGCIYAGAWPVPLPLPTSFGGRDAYVNQLAVQMRSADPAILFHPAELGAMCADAARIAGVEGIDWSEFATRDASEAELPQADPDDVAYLQYSSGSTRFPHGIVLTHRAVLNNLSAHSHGMELKDSDRCVSWLPWYHDMGLVGCFLSVVANQVSADYLKTEDFARRPLAWLDMISRNAGTTLSYSPTFGYDICARRISSQSQIGDRLNLSRWRVAGNGADMIRPDVMQAFVDAFADAGFKPGAFLPSYGLAEATLSVSIMPPGEGIQVDLVEETELSGGALRADRPQRFRAIVNCGKPVNDMRVEIREEDGTLLPERAIGKLWASGPSIMTGYYRDDLSTAACMKGGWLDTGDMGYLRDGYVYVVGRAKDMIIIDGKNHWPQDIEWAVEQLPGFKAGDIAAFAITTPGGEETPAVLVQCRTSDERERARLREEVRRRVRSVTGMDCVIELVPPRTLPRTSSGKLSRVKARNLYLSGDLRPYDAVDSAAA
jgi:fatty-acyl-CoA synthase